MVAPWVRTPSLSIREWRSPPGSRGRLHWPTRFPHARGSTVGSTRKGWLMKTFSWTCGVIALALVGCAVTEDDGTSMVEQHAIANGKKLFERETFGGNGRTCATCHGAATGTVSPAE